MSANIIVIGSLNLDLVVTVDRHPQPGETLLGNDYATYPGGKGANQAVAAAKVGGAVTMVGVVGGDDFGRQLKANLDQHGVNTAEIDTVSGASGTALITVDAQGQNTIVVSPGANAQLQPDRLSPTLFHDAGLVLLQLEIPLATVEWAIATAKAMNVPVLLNPAPIQPLADAVLAGVTYLVVNESEAALLSDTATSVVSLTPHHALTIAQNLRQRGPQTAIVTLGAQGVVWAGPEGEGYLPAYSVPVVDTTAAGDGFCGALAAQLVTGVELPSALQFANAAAAIAVTRAGAQPSLASQGEVAALLAKHLI